MKQKLAQALHVFKSKESQLSEMDTKLRSLSKIKTLPQLEEEREKLMDEIRVINEKLRYYEAQEKQAKVRWEYYRVVSIILNLLQLQLSSQDIKKIENKYSTVSTAYRKRKRICSDMLDAILEGYPKTKKALISDIGLETDEEVGFNVEIKR